MSVRAMCRAGAWMAVALASGNIIGACGDEASNGTTSDGSDATSPSDTSDDTNTSVDGDVAVDTTPAVVPGQARVFTVDPIVTPDLQTVTLAHLEAPYGVLTGPYARVRSCTPDLARGKQTTLEFQNGSIDVTSCVPEAKALPNADGSYVDIAPPTSPEADDGRFAEVMMYHHMQVIHDYYKDFYGLTDRDHPLEALTNVETFIDECDDWEGIANAAFVPQIALDYFVTGLDVGDIHGDAIIFSGTADKNFSLDASVIYHEYTHAMLGATRLTGVFLDDQGINNLPGALNEAYADYFAATQTGQPTIGVYALNDLAEVSFCGASDTGEVTTENYARDLRAERRCPDDLTAEVHADSEIFSTALWAMRDALGKLKADSIALYAVVQLTDQSDFDAAASYTIQAAKELYGDEAEAAVRAVFEARNLVDCGRVVPIDKVGSAELTLRLEGTRALEPNPFPGYAPGYMQFGFEVPEGIDKVILTLDIASGGGGGGGGQPLQIDAVLKPGGEPVFYTYGLAPGAATHDGKFTVPLTDKQVVIEAAAGQTLQAGPWTMALHNKARRGARLSHITPAFQTSVP